MASKRPTWSSIASTVRTRAIMLSRPKSKSSAGPCQIVARNRSRTLLQAIGWPIPPVPTKNPVVLSSERARCSAPPQEEQCGRTKRDAEQCQHPSRERRNARRRSSGRRQRRRGRGERWRRGRRGNSWSRRWRLDRGNRVEGYVVDREIVSDQGGRVVEELERNGCARTGVPHRAHRRPGSDAGSGSRQEIHSVRAKGQLGGLRPDGRGR